MEKLKRYVIFVICAESEFPIYAGTVHDSFQSFTDCHTACYPEEKF